MIIHSYSRISCFEQCPLKFKFKYVDKVKIEVEETVEAFLGSRVHETLEKLYYDLKFEKLNSIRELINYYNSEWEKNWNDNILIVRDEYDKENFRRMGEKFITDYYNHYKPFDQDKTIGLEMKVVIKLDDVVDDKKEGDKAGYVLQGFIDRLSFKDGVYEIHDYKTANTLPAQNEVDHDRQLALYSIAVKQMFRDCEEVVLVWHYLAFDKELRSKRTDEELSELKKEVVKIIKQIERCKEYKPRESPLCDWCVYRELCPRFKHLVGVEEKKPKEFLADDGVRLVNEYANLKVKEKEIAERLGEIKDNIFAFAEQKVVDKIYGSDAVVSVWKKECVKFPSKSSEDYEKFVDVLKRESLWDEFSTLDKFKLERAFENVEIEHRKMIPLSKFAHKELIKRLYLRRR